VVFSGYHRSNQLVLRPSCLRTSLGIQSQQPTGLTQQVDTLEKEPKQNYLPYYNRRHGRYGVLWADRLRAFCSKGVRLWPQWLLISNSTRFVPVFVPDPKDYRYCGYAEALAKGSSLARQGISIVLGHSEAISWKEVSRQYRQYLFAHGSLHTKTQHPAFDLATAQTVVDQQKGELSLPERLRCRIRYFTDGLIVGSQSFVESQLLQAQAQAGLPTSVPGHALNSPRLCRHALGFPRSANPTDRLGSSPARFFTRSACTVFSFAP
jgi:putative transposase